MTTTVPTAESASRDRPILFNEAMVRAILSGRKTQTRRVVQPAALQKGCWFFSGETPTDLGYPASQGEFWAGFRLDPDWEKESPLRSAWYTKCPYGKPGDRLWVRETFQVFDAEGRDWPKGNGLPKELPEGWHVTYGEECPPETREVFPFRPSIHMPRWASRLTLEVAAVRVERLMDISEADAMAEGIEVRYPVRWEGSELFKDYLADDSRDPRAGGWYTRSQDSFRSLWQSIHGRDSWTENPWVWVVEFNLVQGKD